MKQNITLDAYVRHLQELQAQGHGQLLVCACDDLGDWGWEALSDAQLPCLMDGVHADKDSTKWSAKSGPFIAL